MKYLRPMNITQKKFKVARHVCYVVYTRIGVKNNHEPIALTVDCFCLRLIGFEKVRPNYTSRSQCAPHSNFFFGYALVTPAALTLILRFWVN